MPFIVGRQGIDKDLQGERGDRLVDAGAPELVAKGGKEEWRGFPGDPGKSQHAAGNDAGEAVRKVMESTERQLGTPSPRAASRTFRGTMSSISSVVRVMVGTIMMPKATPPASAEKCFCGTTMSAYTAMPITIEGTPLSTSAVKRTILAKRLPRPNSAM